MIALAQFIQILLSIYSPALFSQEVGGGSTNVVFFTYGLSTPGIRRPLRRAFARKITTLRGEMGAYFAL